MFESEREREQNYEREKKRRRMKKKLLKKKKANKKGCRRWLLTLLRKVHKYLVLNSLQHGNETKQTNNEESEQVSRRIREVQVSQRNIA